MTNPPTINFKFQIWPGHRKMTNPKLSWKVFKFQIWPWHGKMTDPNLTKILNFRLGLDMERWLTPDLTKQYKFQNWPGHGKMTDSPTLTENFQFQIVSGHGKMPYPQPSLKFLNFRFDLDMERWLTSTYPHWKVLNFRIVSGHGKDALTPTPSLKFLNLSFGLDME